MSIKAQKERYAAYIRRPDVNVAGLARLSGLHINTIKKAKRDKWDPPCSTLEALEKAIDGVNPDVPDS